MSSGRTIAIAGAGSIGCFVGGMLAARVRSVSADIGEVASDHFPLRVDIDLETPGLASGGV